MPVQGWEIPNALGSQGFAWPAGRPPGFSAQHVAGNACRFSAVAYQGNFFQVGGSAGILSGKGTFVSTLPTFNMDGFIGPCNNTAGGSSYVQFTGVNRPFDQQITIAVIMRILATPSAATAMQVGATGGTGCAGMRFPGSTSMYLDTFGAGDFPTWTAGATFIGTQNPIFVIMSGQAAGVGVGLANYMSMRLDTGAYRTASFSGGAYALSAPTTWNYRIGNNPNAGGGLVAAIAAVMVSGQFMTIPQMLQWAEDPWSFWYPQSPTALILQSLQAPSGANPFNVSPGDTKGDLPQIPWRPDSNQIYFYNPSQMNTGQNPVGAQSDRQRKLTGWQYLRTQPNRSVESFYNPTTMNTGAKPAGADVWDLSPRQVPFRPDETWSYNFNPTQLNSAPIPAGKQVFDTSLRQPPPRPDETWTWNYNPTYMNSGAKPAGASEWELPRARFRMDATWTWPGIQSTPFPLNQYDWPLPGRAPRPDEWFAGFYNPTQMQTGAQPFFQTEWMAVPWPRFRPSSNWDWPTPPGFYPTAVALPFNQYDWPVPRAYPRPIYGGIYARQVGTGNEPFFQTEWPLPIPPWRPSFNYDWQNPFRLTTGNKPFLQTEWPTPTPFFRPWSNWDWSTPVSYYPTILPRNQYDWPLPGRYPRPDETWVSFLNPTQMASPFFQTDWPVPRAYPRPDETWVSFNNPTMMASPFFQTDWPVPRGYPRPDETWAVFYNPTYMQSGQKPVGFQHYDLTGRPYRPDENWVSNPLTFTTVIAFPPGAQVYDIPWRVDPAAFKRGSSYARRSIQASQPFAQYDWPLPTPPFRPSFNFDPPISNVFTVPAVLPFNQYDWPLPVPLFRPNFNYQYYYVIEQIVQNPFYQTEWPLPLVALQPNRSFDWSPLTFLRVTPLPFNQYDWPLPTPKFRIEQTTSFSYNPTQMATGAKPFAQLDWPLPSPDKRGNITIYTVTAANNPNIYTPPTPSTVKIEWLIRARRRGRR